MNKEMHTPGPWKVGRILYRAKDAKAFERKSARKQKVKGDQCES